MHIAAQIFAAAVLGSGDLPPEVGFIGNLLYDPSFEHGGDGGWATDGGGVTFSNATSEVRSGIGKDERSWVSRIPGSPRWLLWPPKESGIAKGSGIASPEGWGALNSDGAPCLVIP